MAPAVVMMQINYLFYDIITSDDKKEAKISLIQTLLCCVGDVICSQSHGNKNNCSAVNHTVSPLFYSIEYITVEIYRNHT